MAETLIAYTRKDVFNLAHDVMLTCVYGRDDKRDQKHGYQAKLMAQLLRDNPDLFDPVIEELSHVSADVAIQRFINRLEDFVDTKDWPIPAEEHV
jgi:hypothetical protein